MSEDSRTANWQAALYLVGILLVWGVICLGIWWATRPAPPVWQNFSTARLARANETDRLTVLRFDAEWNLYPFKPNILSDESLNQLLRSNDIVALHVDLTSNNNVGFAVLQSLGHVALPTYAILDEDGVPVFVTTTPRRAQLVAAINAAMVDD